MAIAGHHDFHGGEGTAVLRPSGLRPQPSTDASKTFSPSIHVPMARAR